MIWNETLLINTYIFGWWWWRWQHIYDHDDNDDDQKTIQQVINVNDIHMIRLKSNVNTFHIMAITYTFKVIHSKKA